MPRATPNTPQVKKHEYDSITRGRRRKRFGKTGYVHSIESLQEHHHLSSIKLMARAKKAMRRIEATSNGQTKTAIAFKQALFINNEARSLVDAEIDAVYRTSKEESGIKVFETKSQKEKDKIKGELFDKWVEHLISLAELKRYPRAIKALDEILNYLQLPHGIYRARGKHNLQLKKIRNRIIRLKIDPMENFIGRVDKIMSKKKTGKTSAAKAMTICVAASLYADVQYKKGKSAGEKMRWLNAYRDAMKAAYPKIKIDEKLLNAITSLK